MQKNNSGVQNPLSDRENMKRTSRQIKYSTVLTPWMLAYAEWLTLECLDPPKIVLRTSRARELSRSPVASSGIRDLEARLDFRAYCNELARGPLERARAKFVAAFPEYISAHRDALDSARSVGDYRAMAQIAEPVLDRVYPKKAEGMQAQQVTIVLSPTQQQGVSAAYAAPLLIVDEPTPPVNDSPDTAAP